MSSLLKGGSALLVSACFAAPTFAQSTMRAEAVTAPVKDAGVFRVATGTWERGSQSQLALGASTLFNNNAPSGYFNPQDPNQTQVGEGRIPSTASEGNSDSYLVRCWATAYCTDDLAAVDATGSWFNAYASCSDPATAIALSSNSVTGLPGAAIIGSQSCWIVTLDMTGTTDEFSITGDVDAILDGVEVLDNFGWGTKLDNVGTSTSTGLLIAGDPDNAPHGAGTEPLWGFAPGPDGTGLQELDQFYIDDTTNASGSGCFWFGGYANNDIWGGHWHQIIGDGGSTTCDDGGSPGNYCGPGGQFASQPSGNTAVITGPSTISASAVDFTLSAVNLDINPDQPGQFIGNSAPGMMAFMNYQLCVAPGGLQRLLPIQPSSGGSISTTINIASGAQTPTGTTMVAITAGTTHYFQRWNREPGVGMGSNLSNGWAACITP